MPTTAHPFSVRADLPRSWWKDRPRFADEIVLRQPLEDGSMVYVRAILQADRRHILVVMWEGGFWARLYDGKSQQDIGERQFGTDPPEFVTSQWHRWRTAFANGKGGV